MSQTPNIDVAALTEEIKSRARELGFDLAGVAPAVTPTGFERLQWWLRRGYAGEMRYIADREAAYEHPRGVMERTRSIVALAVNHNPGFRDEPSATTGRVARYAQGPRDYHDVLRDKLKRLARVLHEVAPGCKTRGVVDTAPLLERDFAQLAGLGWFGKNTMLINKRAGSWLFLAALLTDLELAYDEPHTASHCGTCTRCLEACPTDAFPEPYVLDSRRCISYLTIELRDAIPRDLREGLGDWVFGCDVCQEVCPWNRKAPVATDPAFLPEAEATTADVVELLGLDEQAFRTRFRHTPLWRPGRAGLLRNAALVLGNRKASAAVPALCAALADAEPLIRGAAAWALGQIGGETARAALLQRLAQETDGVVREEAESALVRN